MACFPSFFHFLFSGWSFFESLPSDVLTRRPHLLLRQVDSASVAAAHAQFGQTQAHLGARLEPRRAVVHVLHVHGDGGHGGEEGLVGGRAVERVPDV